MKKFLSFLILATAIVVAGCSGSTDEPTNTKSATAIKGHTYKTTSGSNYISFYFASDFTCTMTANMNGEYSSNAHMTYKIDGNNVDVYADHSAIWKAEYRGSLLYHMVYRPSDDTLDFEGAIFKRVN